MEEKDLQAIAQLIDAGLDAKLDAKLAPISDRLDQMEGRMDQMQADLAHVKARLDYDADKRLDAINEGVDTIQETMVHKSRVEQLEDDVIVLKTAVKMLTQEVAELKKAQ